MTVHPVLESRAIIDMARVHFPVYNQTEVIQDKTQLATDNPTAILQPLAANLFFGAAFATGVNQFNAIGISQAEERMVSHEAVCPLFV